MVGVVFIFFGLLLLVCVGVGVGVFGFVDMGGGGGIDCVGFWVLGDVVMLLLKEGLL